jgi:hypothetical protein
VACLNERVDDSEHAVKHHMRLHARLYAIGIISFSTSLLLADVLIDPQDFSMNYAASVLYAVIVCLVWFGIFFILVSVTGGMPRDKR